MNNHVNNNGAVCTIIFQNENFIAVSKEQPLPMLKGKTDALALQEAVRTIMSENQNQEHSCIFLEAPHRIDERTSGIALFCKTRASLVIINYLFQNGMVRKKYYALVEADKFPEGESGILRHRLYHDERSNKTYAKAVPSCERKHTAELAWKLVASHDSFSMLEIEPYQGKTHQIRAQLAAVHAPIVGDIKYGSHIRTTSGFLMLHAGFIHFPFAHNDESLKLLDVFIKKQNRQTLKVMNKLLLEPVTITAPFPEREHLWESFKDVLLKTPEAPALLHR